MQKPCLAWIVPVLLWSATLAAQSPEIPSSALITTSSKAVGYQVGRGTFVDLIGTQSMRQGNGHARVEAKKGITSIEVQVRRLDRPSTLGAEFLTFVLWAVSPDGRTNNLGEIQINDSGAGSLRATTQLQTFSLIVTAEPYFSVRQPSELVVLENAIRHNTNVKIFLVDLLILML
jgi:hypothetical protein